MAQLTLLWLLICPLVLSLAWLLLAGRGLQHLKYLGASALIASSGLLALAASYSTTLVSPVCLFTHPSAGSMCMLAEPSPLRLCALLCFLLAALIAIRHRSMTITPLQASFLFASLSAGCLALVSEHFLLRYIALELAAIWFLIELFLAFRGEDVQMRHSVSAFINLRVGDVGLLIGIFLLYSVSGSFIIQRSLASILLLNPVNRALATGGLLLAAWVKLGAWPLNWWVRIGERLHASLFSWFCRLLIPILGGYLLYRSADLIQVSPNLKTVLLAAASLCALGSALIRVFQTAYRDTILANQSYSACVLLCLAGTGASGQILPALASFLVVRLVTDLLRGVEERFQTGQRRKKTRWLLWARMLELLLSAPLVIHAAQNALPRPWTWLLWMAFGLQFLLTAGKMDVFFLAMEPESRSPRPAMRTFGLMLLSAAGAYILHHLTRWWLSVGHTLWQPDWFSQSSSHVALMLAGIATAAVILLSIKLAQNSPALVAVARQAGAAFSVLSRRETAKGLELTDVFDQYPHLLQGFGRLSHFLYQRVEHFTSVEVWHKLQSVLFAAARRLQGLHTGRVRLNLVWVMVLLAILVGLYLSGSLDVINPRG